MVASPRQPVVDAGLTRHRDRLPSGPRCDRQVWRARPSRSACSAPPWIALPATHWPGPMTSHLEPSPRHRRVSGRRKSLGIRGTSPQRRTTGPITTISRRRLTIRVPGIHSTIPPSRSPREPDRRSGDRALDGRTDGLQRTGLRARVHDPPAGGVPRPVQVDRQAPRLPGRGIVAGCTRSARRTPLTGPGFCPGVPPWSWTATGSSGSRQAGSTCRMVSRCGVCRQRAAGIIRLPHPPGRGFDPWWAGARRHDDRRGHRCGDR